MCVSKTEGEEKNKGMARQISIFRPPLSITLFIQTWLAKKMVPCDLKQVNS